MYLYTPLMNMDRVGSAGGQCTSQVNGWQARVGRGETRRAGGGKCIYQNTFSRGYSMEGRDRVTWRPFQPGEDHERNNIIGFFSSCHTHVDSLPSQNGKRGGAKNKKTKKKRGGGGELFEKIISHEDGAMMKRQHTNFPACTSEPV